MNPLADLWLAMRCWYYEQLIRAVVRKGGEWHPIHRETLWALCKVRKQMRQRGLI